VTEQERIEALELALEECINYMQRLPLVPATSKQIIKAHSVLTNRLENNKTLVGDLFFPFGVHFLGIRVQNSEAMITSGVQGKYAEKLIAHLNEGVKIYLTNK